jgi:hypothetical protein
MDVPLSRASLSGKYPTGVHLMGVYPVGMHYSDLQAARLKKTKTYPQALLKLTLAKHAIELPGGGL